MFQPFLWLSYLQELQFTQEFKISIRIEAIKGEGFFKFSLFFIG